ncbi:hypothetical protein [Escherichia coli]|nr:hypothetical protein [Escherichia coli]
MEYEAYKVRGIPDARQRRMENGFMSAGSIPVASEQCLTERGL